MNGLRYIDLFAGAGGLSEGFYNAGYTPVAHVEMNAAACKTLRTRSAYYYLSEKNRLDIYERYLQGEITDTEFYRYVPENVTRSVIQAGISDESLPEIFKRIDELRGGKKIDLLIGGPPCQAYSIVGRARLGKEATKEDPRYRLYLEYAEFLKYFKPAVFVFENVQGLLSAEGGALLPVMKSVLETCGYKISYELLNAAKYGVLQERKRLILIGRRGNTSFDYPVPDDWPGAVWTTGDALFSDLPPLRQGETPRISEYLTAQPNEYLAATHLRNGSAFVTQHITRPHNERDLKIYRIAIRAWLKKGQRLRYCDLPAGLKTHKNEKDFADRFKVINPNGNSHTVVAHLAKDGHHFIYPDADNPRSVSVREAARIQSFPDDFFFEGSRNDAFRQIGNAVPLSLAA